jgi:hypothetical protein
MARALVLALTCLAVAGCGAASDDTADTTTGEPPAVSSPQRLPEDEHGNFTLYVSNQSFDIAEVDIRIEIDGLVAVDDTFAVENQHNWVEFVFDLPKGEHVIEAMTERGGARLSRHFTVTKQHWAVVDYWYYPGEPKHFSFSVSDEPIGFA